MQSIIDLNQIELIPNKTLSILRDNLEEKNIYCLCLKDNITNFSNNIDFRIGFITVLDVPICTLMIKIGNKIYKNLVSFYFSNEITYLKKLLSLKRFNLFLLLNTNIFIFNINNYKNISLFKAISAVESNMPLVSYNDVILAKEEILKKYTDNELWNLAK